MNFRPHAPRPLAVKILAIAALLLVAPATRVSRAQTVAPEPRREQLLNGLRLLLVPHPGDAKVWMKLRVHSGAAFDLANKEGTMALLADALFPDPSTQQYVTEELGGRLDVRTTYDAVEVTLSGNASEFDRLVEVLRNAFLQMRLAPEEVQRLKDARLKSVGGATQTPATNADRAVRARLFGAHPYGRTVDGTTASLAAVQRADLMLARERFLNPNNATLVAVGGFERARAMRTFRQFLGAWRKSETIPPSTFTQPAAPDPRALVVAASSARDAEVRVAARGVSRSDRDRAAASLLAHVARERWRAALADASPSNVSVRHDSYAVGGAFEMSATVPSASAARAVESAREALRALASAPASAAELERARRDAAAARAASASQFPFADEWLDAATYNYDAASDARAFNDATPAELQRVAARLFRDAPLATVVAGDAAELRAALANLSGGVEVAGSQPAPQKPAPAQPQPSPRRPSPDR
ncbi:MAG: insulinase family protein [Acidobacteria bacterium]|nr:insulinase family protein [Acidobacteriota bacterium]